MSHYLKVKPLIEWWRSLTGRLVPLGPGDLREDQQLALEQVIALLISGSARAAFEQASDLTGLDEEGWAALAVSLAVAVTRSRKPLPAPPLTLAEVMALDAAPLQTQAPEIGFMYPPPPAIM